MVKPDFLGPCPVRSSMPVTLWNCACCSHHVAFSWHLQHLTHKPSVCLPVGAAHVVTARAHLLFAAKYCCCSELSLSVLVAYPWQAVSMGI